MRHPLLGLIAAAFVAGTPAVAAAPVDPDAPVYENGPVWDFTEVKTADGHFDDYMAFLASKWRTEQEAYKKEGLVLGYKIFTMIDPRDGEGDLMLAIEYPNMAVMDRSVADQYALQKKIFGGSLATASQQQAARGSIRTIKADYLMRELVLK
jgi:hypothetical protein